MDVRQCLYEVCRDVLGVSEKVIGRRHARHIIIRSNDVGGEVFITSSSSHFLRETKSKYSDPLSRVLFEVLSHNSIYGDMGWFCLLFATKLVTSAIECEMPIDSALKGYSLAYKMAVRKLDSVRMHIRWSNQDSILCLIRSLIGTKTSVFLHDDELNHISSCILDAFLSSLSEFGDSFSPNIHFSEWIGLAPACFRHLPNTLCLEIPLPRLFPNNGARGVKVAVFESSLEIPPLRGVSVLIEPASSSTVGPGAVKTVEYRVLRNMRDVFIRSGVGLVCCQRRIHPYLQRLLLAAGVVCIPRLSIRYLQSLLAISGAQQLGAFSSSLLDIMDGKPSDPPASNSSPTVLDPLSLGYLDRLEVQYTSRGHPFLVVTSKSADEDEEEAISRMDAIMTSTVAEVVRSRRLPLSTLRVCGRTDEQCRELRGACEQVVRVLSQMLQAEDLHPRVLPGAGCWQAFLAHLVKEDIQQEWLGSGMEKQVKRAMFTFCDALQHCANAVGGQSRCHPLRMDSTSEAEFEFPSSLRMPHPWRFRSPCGSAVETAGLPFHAQGLRPESENEGDGDDIVGTVLHADVLDAFGPSMGALAVALEGALCVLDVDGVMTQTNED